MTHEVEKNTGYFLFTQQFVAMLLKRMLYTWRNKLLTISQIGVPLFFTIITVIIIKTLPDNDGTAAKIPFNLSMYGQTYVSYLLMTSRVQYRPAH